MGGAHLHDALYLAADEKLSAEIGRKALVLVASGDDQGSKWKLDDAIAAAQKVDATVYAVRYVDKSPCWARLFVQSIPQQHVLQKIAGETGGRVPNPGKDEDLRKAYLEIARSWATSTASGIRGPILSGMGRSVR
jgi:hypothetical protein